MSDDLVYRLRQERVDETAKCKHEPVAWLQTIFGPGGHVHYRLVHDSEMKDTDKSNYTPLYASPPKREWVGLTEKQYSAIETRVWNEHIVIGGVGTGVYSYALWKEIEAKLKEKNHAD
jgi:hypothetical protein